MDNFNTMEVLSNQVLGKDLGCVDSFYINAALVSVYSKSGAEFININDSVKKMYHDIYHNSIKIPAAIDDSWVAATLSRYVDNDINIFKSKRSPSGEVNNLNMIKKILCNCFKNSEVKVNYAGLYIDFNLEDLDHNNLFFESQIVTTLRGKLASKFVLKGNKINFCGVTAPAKNLQRYEVLTLQIFINIFVDGSLIKIILSKIGDEISKIFVDNGEVSKEYSFEDFGITWGSFNINRGV